VSDIETNPPEPTLEELIEGHLIVNLTTSELRRFVELGAAPPFSMLSTSDEALDRPSLDMALEEYRLIESGSLAPWFENLWAVVSRPPIVVTLERISDEGRVMWLYGCDGTLVVEQLEADVGFTWVFATTTQFLGRVLLSAGLLRGSEESGDAQLDPLAHLSEWAVVLSSTTTAPGGSVRSHSLILRRTGDHWVQDSGEVCSGDDAAAAIAGFLEQAVEAIAVG